MHVIPSFLLVTTGLGLLSAAACSSAEARDEFDKPQDAGGTSSSGATPQAEAGPGIGNTDGGGPGTFTGDPKTCEQAAAAASYVGCDYWPTVTFNSVFTNFDFAVVVSNVGEQTANVTITGPDGVNETAEVEPGTLSTIRLPWVDSLKGLEAEYDPWTGSIGSGPNTASVLAKGGAYHLVSDIPVVVYQFSPLQYTINDELSVTNDASLLLPSTAMTGTYRVMGYTGIGTDGAANSYGSFVAITGTQDGTEVEVALSSTVSILAGGSIPATNANGTVTLTLDAGDVAQLLSKGGGGQDPSGSLVRASKPVQVITGAQVAVIPADKPTADHLEETVFPAETLGSHYIVQRPEGPAGDVAPHHVRIYGNVDGTVLTYKPSKPTGCPDTIDAGQVVACGSTLSTDFEISGDHEFGVGMYQLGCTMVDPDAFGAEAQGDPSESFAVAIEQYRDSYVFLAPTDYLQNFVTISAPEGTTVTLDDEDVSNKLEAIDGTTYLQARIKLDNGDDGSHTLRGSGPFGIQVYGYGAATSYQYPGGLNLGKIAPIPVN